MKWIDNFLNRITMYRLVFYYLITLIGVAAIFGTLGILPYNPISIIASLIIVLAACWLTNTVFAKLLKVPTNFESFYITAFILVLIIPPIKLAPFDISGFWFLVAASVFAMASKYILAINRKHIFNPAAIAVVGTAFLLNQYASWWVGGNLPLLAFVVIGGLLVVRKIQRFDLVLAFGAAALASIILTNLDFNPLVTAEKALIHTSLFFFAFVMLTEPLTTPPTRPLRIAYGLLVGALFSPAIHLGSLYSTPELALIAGNIFSFAVSPKKKFALKLESKTEIGDNTYDFAFATGNGTKAGKMNFTPGQYMEFTLPLSDASGTDSRGNRRYFTIASSPTEPELHLGIKFYGAAVQGDGQSSSFKKEMLDLQPGDRMLAGSLAGDFTLPRNFEKLVFIAGGIGITPFRSMIKYLSDTSRAAGEHKKFDIILLYANRNATEIPYREVFDEAAHTIGLKTIYVATETQGRIDGDFIMREVHDYHERTFYISGTNAMVNDLKATLHVLKVPQARLKTDFFPGFA